MNADVISTQVRDVSMALNVSNRSLLLCSRMNYETENLDFIDACEPGEVLYDVGACEGRFAVYAALKGLTVHAFEPEAMNHSMLQENINLNNLGRRRIHTHHIAISDRNGEGVMHIGQPWPGGHQKVVEHGVQRDDLAFDFKTTQPITQARLDDYIEAQGLPFPQWMKVDIDGSEEAFLAGAAQTLSDSRLKGMIFELNRDDKRYPFIIKVLEDSGLKLGPAYGVPNEPSLFNIVFSR